MSETSDKFSRAVMDNNNSSEGSWRVNVYFTRHDGSEYCRAVATLGNRKQAREFRDEQYIRFAEPSFYQGAGI